ncbi:hypothetical protein DYB32_001875 [Aphanomyces invadans]|uniref:PH domain-containing protein n=1 Tax=Aphanomyces invadans TaxID=157072 RepID=A0A3R6Z4V6_9STRA|nr:hypothetical protein DYB32_001875 [Aphanomyces invadans]
MYYFVLTRTNQLTAYATDDYEGKPWKFRVQAMMVQTNRSVHFGFIVTTLKNGTITLAATSGQEYKQWIQALSARQPLHPPLTQNALEAQNVRSAASEQSHTTLTPEEAQSDIYLYVPTAVIPLQGNGGLIGQAKDEICTLQTHFGQIVPFRGNLDDPSIQWRIGKPDYALLDLAFLQGKTHNHPQQSLEWMVQNLMKKWEMEVSHKANLDQWSTMHSDMFTVRRLTL